MPAVSDRTSRASGGITSGRSARFGLVRAWSFVRAAARSSCKFQSLDRSQTDRSDTRFTARGRAVSLRATRETQAAISATEMAGGRADVASTSALGMSSFGLQTITAARDRRAHRNTSESTALSWSGCLAAPFFRASIRTTRTASRATTGRRIWSSGKTNLPASARTNRSTVRPAPARSNHLGALA